ncbi:putative proliferating cell nuclear antigen [Apostichopus japonicus]|uniref:DNA sliding clamp PCNA n=1 Tax=Stichopus japonicus TaxID=307972 RepID=A0A2G8KSL6_STIJA|nr:putative proliferating cell nuclear antigen [Apostichopus japonicus]
MFEAKLQQGGLLKKILESVKDLVVDGLWDCDGAAITLQGMDSSHVALVEMLLRAEAFEHYRCDRNVTLGMNHNHLSKILKCANNDDIVILKAADQNPDSCSLILESKNGEKTSDFVVSLVRIDTDQLGIPETEYSAHVKMSSGEFQRICRDLSQFGDAVQITCSKQDVKFSSSGETGKANITLTHSATVDKEEESVTVDLKEPVDLTFALRFLNLFTKATPISDTVTLSLSQEAPLVVEYKIGDSGHIRYFLAPKIQEDEENE